MTSVMIKRIASFFLLLTFIISLLLPLCVPASANDNPSPPENLDGKAIALYDLTHNRHILSKNPDQLLNTSTSAKVMMGLIACEILGERLDESVEISADMIGGVSGYSMGLEAGEKILIRDLLYGAICASYNDAAYALASISSGSVAAFVDEMNLRAQALGAGSTRYTNPIGYPDNEAMVTTLSDTLKIAVAASKNELYMEIASAIRYTLADTNIHSSRTVYNRNYLISSHSNANYYDPSCLGMNAGISGEAGGWSIVTLAKDDGADYICIVLGGSESDGAIHAYETVNTLVSWVRSTYNNHKVFNEGQQIGTTTVKLTALGSSEAAYVTVQDTYIYVPDHSSPEIHYNVEFNDKEVRAPVKAGEIIGKVKIYSNGELVGECPVALKESYESNVIMKAIDSLGQYTKSRAFIITVIIFVISVAIAIVIMNGKSNRYGGGRMRRY